MITLKELVAEQKWNDMSDTQIIQSFFELNDLEEAGLDLINELTKSKINKLKQKHQISEEWVCMLSSKYLYENYDLDIADKLHTLELNYLVNGGNLSKNYLKWEEENIPNIEKPQMYFNPLIVYLEKNNIEFKHA